MANTSPSSSHPSSRARGLNTARNRGLCLVAALVAGMIAAGLYIGLSLVDARRQDLRREIERDLLARAQDRASTFTLWYGTTTNRIQSLADTDLLRLLAVEVKTSGVPTPASSTAPTSQPVPGDNGDGGHAENSTPPEQMVSSDQAESGDSLQAIRKVLLDMTNQTNLRELTLLDAAMQPYVSSGNDLPELSPDLKAAMENVREAGIPLALPARLVDDDFLFDYIQPIFPPAYVMSTGTQPVGYILITCDMNDIVARSSVVEGDNSQFSSRLLQHVGSGLMALAPRENNKPATLLPWPGVPTASTTFATLERTDGTSVYTLTINIAKTPWLVECDVERSAALAAFDGYRLRVFLVVAGCLGVVFLFLGVIWWLIVGQREKAVATELHGLYATINAQGQLLNNVNSAVNDGIVLMDVGNTIHYVNQAFTHMVGMDRSQLMGHTFARALSTHTNLPINPYVAGVLRDGKSVTFTEELERGGVMSTYQVGCSPYRNARGAVEGVVSVYRDITSMLEAERANAHITTQMIHVLVRGIEVFDPYLGGQTLFASTLAQTLGHHMNLDEKHLTTLRIAALLSKVGMIKVPTELRTKEQAFTAEERKLVEKHVDYTREMLSGIDFGVPVQQALYQMHECMDGTGYPQQLKGETILLDARILSVANTFCAVMRPRAYRQARAISETLEILASSRYDRRVVEVLRIYLRSPEGAAFLQELINKG